MLSFRQYLIESFSQPEYSHHGSIGTPMTPDQIKAHLGSMGNDHYGPRHGNDMLKGFGWLGMHKNTADGSVMSEFTLSGDFKLDDGTELKDVSFPSFVPGLKQRHLDYLTKTDDDFKDRVEGNVNKKIPPDPTHHNYQTAVQIFRFARTHALNRLNQGLSPFADNFKTPEEFQSALNSLPTG